MRPASLGRDKGPSQPAELPPPACAAPRCALCCLPERSLWKGRRRHIAKQARWPCQGGSSGPGNESVRAGEAVLAPPLSWGRGVSWRGGCSPGRLPIASFPLELACKGWLSTALPPSDALPQTWFSLRVSERSSGPICQCQHRTKLFERGECPWLRKNT